MNERLDDRPAFYALRGGGRRDWWTLIHPPYTLWHLSYVALGAATAPALDLERLGKALVAFFLAMGIGAHALDELNGRPLGSRIPSSGLALAAIVSIGAAAGLGLVNLGVVGWVGLPFIAFGAFIVCAYNLEWFGGRFHSAVWFALAWGGFPALTGHWAVAGRFDLRALPVIGACVALSAAQRSLSTPVRALRRRTVRVEGTIERSDGTVEQIGPEALGGPAEGALRWLSAGLPLLAAGAVLTRLA
jgi:hypothetical protein